MNPLQKEEHIFPVTRRLIQLLDTVIQLPRVIKSHDHSPDVRKNKQYSIFHNSLFTNTIVSY